MTHQKRDNGTLKNHSFAHLLRCSQKIIFGQSEERDPYGIMPVSDEAAY
ncbi:hypothetical protein JWG39_04960 [Desulforhopalus vacuolatus]|nr:hypothetical protein [Desulforhopalus vacuolatus]MBM9519168.1 hypothetical protein [Desulforhopalus vacuolatus]